MTNGTPSSEGGVRCEVSAELANALFDAGEQRGEYVGIDGVGQGNQDYSDPALGEVSRGLPWEVSYSRRAKVTAHVNLQEMYAIKTELKNSVQETLAPQRLANGVDSRVALGAWANGRSSSFVLNGILRSAIGWLILGRKQAVNW